MANEKCPCSKKSKSIRLECKQCHQWWHAKCVSLKGLSKDDLVKLTEWRCPLCYTLPEAIPLGKLEKLVKTETEKITAQIKKVEVAIAGDKLKKTMSDVVKANLTEHVDSFTEALSANSDNTRRHIAETIKQSNEEVVTQACRNSKQLMDNDALAREQRKCNVIIRDITESTRASPRERQEEDLEFTQQLLGVDRDRIIKVIRAGPPIGSRENDTRLNRPVVITVESPELAAYLHNHGRGWKVRDDYDNTYWVNPDLIQADRKAAFHARKLARRRRGGGLIVSDSVSQTSSPAASHTGSHSNSPTVHANRVPVINGRDRLSSVSTVSSASHVSLRSRRSDSRSDLH